MAAERSDADWAKESFTQDGTLTRAGWEATGGHDEAGVHYASIDVRAMGAMDAGLGHTRADEQNALIRQTLERFGGARFRVARVGGDELAAKGDPLELGPFLRTVKRALAAYRSQVHGVGEGAMAVQGGLRFIFGIGPTRHEADAVELARVKSSDPHGDDDGTADGRNAKHWYERRTLRFNDRAAFDAARPDWRPTRPQALEPRGVLEVLPRRTKSAAGREDARGGQAESRAESQGGEVLRVVPEVAEPARLGDLGSDGGSGSRFKSETESVIRGWFDENTRQIALTPDANLSTFIHESGHFFLEALGDLAGREDAPQQVKDDYAALLKWFGVERREDIKREHHEKFARSFERYLMEGRAPSSALQRAFERFRIWLTRIYRILAGLDVELNDEVRSVFDRMLATDEEIARARGRPEARPLFASADEAGMTEQEWLAYMAAQRKAAAEERKAAPRKALESRLREAERWWKEEKRREREAAEEEYDQLPATLDWRYLRFGELGGVQTGPVRLLRSEVEGVVGPEAAQKLHGVLVTDKKKATATLADVAETLGWQPREVTARLREAVHHPSKPEWSKARAAERMREKHSEIARSHPAK
ncbi:MAG: hypothetical protein ACOX6T_02085 [Myxococcales bacterium]